MLTQFSTSPASVKSKPGEEGKSSPTDRRKPLENGHPATEVDESGVRKGENLYTKYYQQQSEQVTGQVSVFSI
jgi:pre-mRNA-processing factor 39